MSSKKFSLMLGLLSLTSVASFAQSSNTSDEWVFDSSKYRSGKLAQYNAFQSYTNPYPAKPRNQMEFGIGVGPSLLFSPIDPKLGWGASASLRKAFGHVVSGRLSYGASIAQGQDYRTRDASGDYNQLTGSANGAGPNWYNPWRSYIYNPVANGGPHYVANFKSFIQQASADLIFSLNSISAYRGNPKVDFYALAGYSFNWAKTVVNAFPDASGNSYYNWSNVDFSAKRSDIHKAVDNVLANNKKGFFDMHTGNGIVYGPGRNGNRDNAVSGNSPVMNRHGIDLGGGVAFKVSKRFNIGLEQKFTFFLSNSDVLAGLVMGPQGRNTTLSQTQVRFNFNIGSSSKRIEPLWWVNPNNYVYNELNAPRHLKIGLPDADGDGVTDALDLEPNTPAGAAVDTHGRALDTDGDGVPDYKDKQKLTPQSWFPVDADGVGTEPEPACCKELRDQIANLKLAPASECGITTLPSVVFKGGSVSLSNSAQAVLSSAAAQLNANPSCKVKVIGYGASNKKAQQLSWDRVNAIIKYLVSKQGISESRLLFFYGQDGDANTVDLQATTEDGPNTVPAPHPNLQKTK